MKNSLTSHRRFLVGNPQFITEPEVKEVGERIWKSQVIISCPNLPHAYLGPIPDDNGDNKELNAIFPCHKKCPPLVFSEGPYNLGFMKNKLRIKPKYDNNEEYICWLDKVEGKKGQFWKDIGIFDLIQLSRQGPRYNKEILIATLHFWNTSSSSLHLKCGMLTPTLLDVAAITGLKPTSSTFDPEGYESELSFDFNRFAYGIFIKEQHKTESVEVTVKEHVAFLTYWLSMYIFYTRSIQVVKGYKNLAIQLHEGRDVILSKLILGSLYESLNQAVVSIKEYQPGGSLLFLALFGCFNCGFWPLLGQN